MLIVIDVFHILLNWPVRMRSLMRIQLVSHFMITLQENEYENKIKKKIWEREWSLSLSRVVCVFSHRPFPLSSLSLSIHTVCVFLFFNIYYLFSFRAQKSTKNIDRIIGFFFFIIISFFRYFLILVNLRFVFVSIFRYSLLLLFFLRNCKIFFSLCLFRFQTQTEINLF